MHDSLARLVARAMARFRAGPRAGALAYRRFARVSFGRNVRISMRARIEMYGGDRIAIGDASIIQAGVVLISGGSSIAIGRECTFEKYAVVFGHGGVTVGDYALIGAHVVITSVDHARDDVTVPSTHQALLRRPVVIEDDVFIGANATVLPGVTVGRGAVVGAGSVVTHDVEPYSIVGGVPAKVIGRRGPAATAPLSALDPSAT
jgi:acetyltransferase-like isoleucine patch superfamily enzyme